MRNIFMTLFLLLAVGLTAVAGNKHTSKQFQGVKANKGTVTHWTESGKEMLMVSDEFVVPDTPDPHWQIVDSKGNVYLLQRLPVKGDKVNRTVELPSYIKDIAKVQIWCGFAETLLGETSFDEIIKLASK